MKITKQKTDNLQLNLFKNAEYLATLQRDIGSTGSPQEIAGDLAIDGYIRELVSSALKRSPMSRYQVAGEMSQAMGREITKGMIDSWSAESKEQHRFPLAYLPAFSRATGDKDIVRFVCEKIGGFYIEGRDTLRLELGRVTQSRRELSKKERAINDLLNCGDK